MHDVWSPIWEFAKTFGLAGFSIAIAASIAKSWQHRNWLVQQRISDQEKVYLEIKQLFDDFIGLASQRHFRSQRLFWALQSGDVDRVSSARSKYDEVVHTWNDVDLSWRIRFVRNLANGNYLFDEINDQIRIPFVEIGRRLEKALRKSNNSPNVGLTQTDIKYIETQLVSVSQSIFRMGREIYTSLQTLIGSRLDINRATEELLSSGKYDELTYRQLLRAIFTSRASSIDA